MSQLICVKLVSEFWSLQPGPRPPLLVGGGRGALLPPLLILFSPPQDCFLTFALCLLGRKGHRPTGCRP